MDKISFLLLTTLSVPIFAMQRNRSVYRPSNSVLFIIDGEDFEGSAAQAEEPVRADSAVTGGLLVGAENRAQTRAVAERLSALLQDKPEMKLVSDGADFVANVLGNCADTLPAREVAELVDPALYPKLLEYLAHLMPDLDVYISQLSDLADSPTMAGDLSVMSGAQSFCRDLRDVVREKIQR